MLSNFTYEFKIFYSSSETLVYSFISFSRIEVNPYIMLIVVYATQQLPLNSVLSYNVLLYLTREHGSSLLIFTMRMFIQWKRFPERLYML